MMYRAAVSLSLLLSSLATACIGELTDLTPDEQTAAAPLEQNDAEAHRLWQAYVDAETRGKDIQEECKPRFYPAAAGVAKKGMLMFIHGFTACPQQYFDIAERLASDGYDVYLPLLPGHGRTPVYDGYGQYQEKDVLDDLPTTANRGEYAAGSDLRNDRHEQFVATMNHIAALAEADTKVVAGLSGGGSLATGAAITGRGIWDRVLVYAPYYKNPGIAGPASALLGTIAPGYRNDWGDDCRRVRSVGRAGYCSVSVGAIRAMTDYGVWAAQHVSSIDVPIQFVGVDNDPTADNQAIVGAFRNALDATLCLYYRGVPHSIINPKDDAPDLDPRWVPAMQADSIRFIESGAPFGTSGKSSETVYDVPACRI